MKKISKKNSAKTSQKQYLFLIGIKPTRIFTPPIPIASFREIDKFFTDAIFSFEQSRF